MPIITFETGHGQRPALTLDLGETEHGRGGVGFYSDGELGAYGGNLYIFVDGVEYGSLFFLERDGILTIELGQFQEDPAQDWQPTNPLTQPADYAGPLEPGTPDDGGAR